MRRLSPLLALGALAAAGCSRDTSLPPPPGPGSIQGRVVYAVPGQSTRVAAAGARITVLGTSIGATAGADGRFVLANAALTQGELLVQVDLDGDGSPDRQTLLSLAALGARPGRDLALGDVVVVENARVRGRVLRGDVPGASGHAGIVVFVPQGPFTALTGDDGGYVLDDLPEGRVSLTFFKDGYAAAGLDGVLLGAGQDYAARDVTLAPAPAGSSAPSPGAISGQLALSPPASGAGATVAATQIVPDPSLGASAAVTPSGAFHLAGVSPGLYRVEAAKAGYVTAVVANVMVGAGVEVRLAISLAAQGVSAPAPDPVVVPSCVAGARCELPGGCRIGAVSCATGAPACAPVANALDGIPCGTNQVCAAGACVAVCVAGASCRPPADPCREGVISCASGAASCVAGSAALADGAPCGTNQVCRAGACAACFASQVCTPANPCTSGLTECSTGVSTCRDTGLPVADGAGCGPGLFCAAGACAACQPGRACAPAGFPCHAGASSCATGREVCVDSGVVQDGTSCGPDRVCRAGACNDCAEGAPCTPLALPCQAGRIACGSGLPFCVAQPAPAAAGASCGAGRVCDGAGTCVPCDAGRACTPANPCHAGGVACGTGAPVCADLGVPLANGATCGPDRVCLSGACAGCVAGADCTPANPCHRGRTSCTTGAEVCGDVNVPLANGATCGASAVCSGGACVPCATGAPCGGGEAGAGPAPAVRDPCKVYETACASGTPTCDGSQDQPDGTPCGAGLFCRAGSCQTSPLAVVVAAGGGQHALPNQRLPALLAVAVVNVLAPQTPVAAQTVSVTAPPGAQVNPASAVTDPGGVATFALTLGRAVGAQDFVVRHDPSYPSTVAVRMYADAPPDGIALPLVNAARSSSTAVTTGAGPAVTVVNGSAVVAASTGEVYFADASRCQVRRLSPAGEVSIVVNDGTCSTVAGDGGLAVNAGLYLPHALALDEVDRILYVAEGGSSVSHRVRAVDLRSGTISTVVGTGAVGAAPYGDGGPATAAQLNVPSGLALGPGPTRALYVLDGGHELVRRVDPLTGLISSVVAGVVNSGGCASSPGAVALYDFFTPAATGGSYQGAIAVDAQGRLFVAGRFCGGGLGNTPVQGIARVDAGGGLTLVAGAAGGGLGGGPARLAGLGAASGLAFDAAVNGAGVPVQNLFVADAPSRVVLRIDGVTGRLSIVAGVVGTPGSTGDFGAATAATYNAPSALAFVPGTRDLVTMDYGTSALRLVAGAGSAGATRARLAHAGGDQAAWIDQQLPVPLAAALSEGDGAPVAGFPVRFAASPRGNAGASVATPDATTTLAGVAAMTARVGLRPGTTLFEAAFDDLHGDPIPGSPVTFTVTAAGPPAGTAFTLVNDLHLSGRSGLGGPASLARVAATRGTAFLGDGSLAFTSDHSIYRVDGDGILSVLAGNGTPGFTGDGGPATGAELSSPGGLTYDAARNTLYVADTGNDRVRALDLATGYIRTVLGTGTGTTGGDGGPAASAPANAPANLHAAGGWLYVDDQNGSLPVLRRVGIDPVNAATSAGNVYAFLGNGACNPVPAQAVFRTAGTSVAGARVASDRSGALYVPGTYCGIPFGTTTANQTTHGIARVDPVTGAIERIAGAATGGLLTDGQALGNARFPAHAPPALTFDAAGNLWIATRSTTAAENILGWVAPDRETGRVEATGIFRRVGQGTPRSAPPPSDYADAASAFFASPYSVSVDAAGHVFVTNSGVLTGYPSYDIRVVW